LLLELLHVLLMISDHFSGVRAIEFRAGQLRKAVDDGLVFGIERGRKVNILLLGDGLQIVVDPLMVINHLLAELFDRIAGAFVLR